MNNRFRGASKKSILKTTPTSSPLGTGGELITKRFLPLCKGELVGVVDKYKYDF